MASVFISRCHSEKEPGARVPGGQSEWELAPAINEEIRNQLWLVGIQGCRLPKGTLEDRVDAINKLCRRREPCAIIPPPYYAIECHFNCSDSPARSGFFAMAHKFSAVGQALAASITDSMARLLGHDKNKGVNKVDAGHQWIGTDWVYDARRQHFVCATVCPAVLVECGFLSNRAEADWISNRANRAWLGKAIGRGVINYLEGSEP